MSVKSIVVCDLCGVTIETGEGGIIVDGFLVWFDGKDLGIHLCRRCQRTAEKVLGLLDINTDAEKLKKRDLGWSVWNIYPSQRLLGQQ